MCTPHKHSEHKPTAAEIIKKARGIILSRDLVLLHAASGAHGVAREARVACVAACVMIAGLFRAASD
jgi:hypothetical protein